ncbi:MAG: hypothetical protein HY205_01370 [Nitrospirae bacterium]|nr:hypothetical protein [Nitrospirota bacterium]
MRHILGVLTLAALLTGLDGCSYLFYPHAKDFAEKAKGATGIETLTNLTAMMERTTRNSGRSSNGRGSSRTTSRNGTNTWTCSSWNWANSGTR